MKIWLKAACVFWLVVGVAVASPYKEGKHFQRLPVEMLEKDAVEDLSAQYKDKVVVLEFFSYGCHWCYQLDPKVHSWYQAHEDSNIVLLRMPVVFQNSWVNLSKAYFTSLALDVEDTVHPALFEAIQTEKIRSVAPDVLQGFFFDHGVDKIEFAKTFESMGIEQQFKQANQVSLDFKITAIPAFVVLAGNDAKLTSTYMAGGDEALFEVLNHIIKGSQPGSDSVENSD